MIHFIVSLKGRTVSRFDVAGGRVRIGRHPDNEVQIDNKSVSRFHCLLERSEAGAWEVEDQGSHNGTHLNGARAEQRSPIRSGDTLGIGQFHVVVRTDTETLGGDHAGLVAVHPEEGRPPEELERRATSKGFLLRENSPGTPILLDADLLQFGSAAGAIAIPNAPPKCALLVRGYGGFQLVNVSGPAAVWVNGAAVPDRTWLKEGDEMRVGALMFTFHRGLPSDDDDGSTMVIEMPKLPPRPPGLR